MRSRRSYSYPVVAGLLLPLAFSSGAILAGTEPASATNDQTSDDRGPVLVTTSIWADIVANVSCEAAGQVRPLIPPGADPHEYRPSIADAETMRAASLVIANGGGLEEPLEPLLERAAADGTTVMYLTEEVTGGTGDPHLWLDPTITVEAVTVIEQALVDAGLDRAMVGECANAYILELDGLDADIAERVVEIAPRRRNLVTNHDALGRFADRYGFEVIGTVLPSSSSLAQASPSDLDVLAELIEVENVPAIFTEGGHEGEDANALADRLGIPAVRLQTDALGPPDSDYGTYVDLMRTNTDLIVEALDNDGGGGGGSASVTDAVTNPVGWWIAPFTSSPVMQDALIAGLLVVLTTSVVGTWVVLRGMSFLGDALAHGVLPGVAVAFIIGVSTTIGALVAAVLMIAMLSVLRERSPMAEDVSIGVLFVGFLAAAVVILSSGTSSYIGELDRFLFGSILAVDNADLVRQALAALFVLSGVALFHRSFLALTFDRQLAQLLGLRPRLSHAALLVLITVAIVASFEAVGNLLVFAFLVAPPATAALLVRRVPVIMAVATTLGSVSVLIGLLAAYHYGTAAEATMALVAVVMFLATVTLGAALGRPAAGGTS